MVWAERYQGAVWSAKVISYYKILENLGEGS